MVSVMRAMSSFARIIKVNTVFLDNAIWLLCAKSGLWLTNKQLRGLAEEAPATASSGQAPVYEPDCGLGSLPSHQTMTRQRDQKRGSATWTSAPASDVIRCKVNDLGLCDSEGWRRRDLWFPKCKLETTGQIGRAHV